MTVHVLGVGNALVDVIVPVADEFLVEHGIARGAMTMVDQAASDRIYDALPPGIEMSGGSAANTVAGLASLGASTGFLGRVRDDQLGAVFTHDLRALGVRFDVPPATVGPPTGRCLAMVSPDAQRTMCTYLGVSSEFGFDDVDAALVAQAMVTYLEGYLWDQPAAKEAFRRIASVAHDAGQKVAFTLSDGFCVDRHRADFLELIEADVDILFANEVEICALYEVDQVESAVEQIRGHCAFAAVTLGEKGSVLVTDNGLQHIDAVGPTALLDTTGAGDLYAAGVLYGLTHGHDDATTGALGALAASEVISHYGARPETSLAVLARTVLARTS